MKTIKTHYNDDGVFILNLFDFLLEENGLDNKNKRDKPMRNASKRNTRTTMNP